MSFFKDLKKYLPYIDQGIAVAQAAQSGGKAGAAGAVIDIILKRNQSNPIAAGTDGLRALGVAVDDHEQNIKDLQAELRDLKADIRELKDAARK